MKDWSKKKKRGKTKREVRGEMTRKRKMRRRKRKRKREEKEEKERGEITMKRRRKRKERKERSAMCLQTVISNSSFFEVKIFLKTESSFHGTYLWTFITHFLCS